MSLPVSGPNRSVVERGGRGGPRVQGHHQPVVARHAGHLEQQVPAQRGGLGLARVGGQGHAVDPRSLRRLQRVRPDVVVAVVGRDGAVCDEVPAARLQRPHETREVAGVEVSGLAQLGHRVHPAAPAGLEIAIRAERRDDPARPGRVGGECGVRGQVAAGVVRGRQDRDPEPLVERARAIGVGGQPLGDPVVDRVRRLGRRHQVHLEDVRELCLEPPPHRRAAVDVPVRAQQPPHLPGLRLVQRAAAHTERVQPDPAGMQQPGDVVVRSDEQRGRIQERLVVEQQPRIDVPVRGDDRLVLHGLVEPPGDRADARIRRQ